MAAVDEELAGAIGVHPSQVTRIRKESLTEGEHWTREVGTGRVEITAAGREELQRLLGLEKISGGAAPALPPGGLAAGPVAALPEPVGLRIVRMLPNPLWVAVAVPGGRLAEVLVRRREGLRAGVLLRCVEHPDGRWECVHPGHAAPLPGSPKNERGGA